MLFAAAASMLAGFSVSIPCDSETKVAVKTPFVEVVLEDGGSVTIFEAGRELEVFQQGFWTPISLPGPRFGRKLLKTSTSIKVRPAINETATAVVRFDCSNRDIQEETWFTSLQSIAEKADSHLLEDREWILAKQLIDSAPTPVSRANASHFRANLELARDDLSAARVSFESAASLWSQLTDKDREALALLGAAHVLDRLSDYLGASQIAKQAEAMFIVRSQDYFVQRAREIPCRQLYLRANRDPFHNCVEGLIAAYHRINEPVEEIGHSIDLLQSLQQTGHSINLQTLQSQIERLPTGNKFGFIRGNFHLVNAQIATEQGDFSKAFVHFQLCLKALEQASEDTVRWRVFVLTQIASLQSRIGLFEQSLMNVVEAFKLTNGKTHPARAAQILSTLGTVSGEMGDTRSAAKWFLRAAQIFELSGRSADALNSRLGWLESQVNSVQKIDLGSFDQFKEVQQGSKSRVEILKTRVDIREMRHDTLKSTFQKLKSTSLSPLDQNELALAQAEFATANTDLNAAGLLLTGQLSSIAERADFSFTAPIAYLTLRSGEKVRRAWVDALTPTSEIELVFRTALLANPARFMTSVKSAQKRVETVAKQAAGEQGFLAQLTGPQEKPERFSAAQVPSLAQFQARLPTDGLALVLLPGDRQSVALWIGKDFSKLALLPARATLQAAAVELGTLLASPQSAPSAVTQAADKLSALLFKNAPEASPASLWIVADELSAAIPFSSLAWPGQTEPLIAGTDLSLLTGLLVDPSFSAPTNKQAGTSAPLPSFFAPDYRGLSGALAGAAPRLSSLDFAKVEHTLIERESRRTWPALTGKQATRSTFQDLIQTPGAWLHVAAHGRANPGVLGNAGLWLANAEGPDADFLSWLELGNVRTQAELMVLNACQSATGAQPSRQANVSFALAMSTSGAQHVVAALWPVSDVASGTWIPAFYRNLAQSSQAEASSAALRQAQLTLYRSPHYRHPFYWASLVHFRRVVF